MKSCPSISVDFPASNSGTPSGTAVAVAASCDSTANDKAPRTTRNYTGAFPSLSGQQASFSSVLVHGYRRDCSKQFCKTLCDVLLSSQLSFECSILIRQRIHLLLQRSYCIFHFWDRVGSHARDKSLRSEGFHRQHSATKRSQQLRDNQELSSTRDFASRPPTSSILVQTTTDLVQRFANELHSFSKQRTSETQDSATLRYHVCPVSAVSCAQLSCTLEPDNGLCNTHDECARESTLSMSRPVNRLQKKVLCEYGMWMVWGSNTPPDDGANFAEDRCPPNHCI